MDVTSVNGQSFFIESVCSRIIRRNSFVQVPVIAAKLKMQVLCSIKSIEARIKKSPRGPSVTHFSSRSVLKLTNANARTSAVNRINSFNNMMTLDKTQAP